MARIRSIKPEFWDSESVGAASLRARLLFIAMWNWADDYGIGDATPIRLIGFAFPNDELGVADFPPLREEISERFEVVFYKHEGRPYFYVPSWEKHQRTEKRAKQRIPFPHDIENVEMTALRPKVAENPPPSGGTPDAGTGEQGNREEGTGEQGKKELSRKPGASEPEDFAAFWDAYGKKVDRGKALAAFKKATRDVDPGAILSAAHAHADWHRRAGTESKFIKHPASWLNAQGWLDERPDPTPPTPRHVESTTDARVQNTLAIAARLREQEQQQPHLRAIGSNE